MSRSVCIHGHFYQPPRENPWLEAVEVEDSAEPYHDWNQRITAECYAPNASARRLGSDGRIERIVNNYEKISFNFGPTLLAWLAQEAPAVHEALIEADRASAARWGQGNALAQVYNHQIMPLASRRDKITQIRWGLKDFAHRFKRQARGMWLAETAVDSETLACLAAEGVEFTILSPFQAQAVRSDDDAPWQDASQGKLDTSRPYWVELPGGGRLAVFFYHGELSKAVAFEKLLNDGAGFARRIKQSLPPEANGPSLLSLATDGESYGHHHRFGEMALAFALEQLEQDPEVELTNYAAFLEAHPPSWQARIVEDSSWSCPHGVERWRSDCGCALEPDRGWSQAWRTPLRDGLNQLREHLDRLFEDQGGGLFRDPWAARDDYVGLILDPSLKRREAFFARHQVRALDQSEMVRGLKLLECMRWGQAMFTSCGWFFDDLAGIEPVQNLRFAARALQLARELNGGGWEEELVATLAGAKSNRPAQGNGADIWQRRVAPAQVGPARVAAHAAISGVMDQAPPPEHLFIYDLEASAHHHRSGLGLHLSWGRLTVTHRRLGEAHHLAYAALHPGGHQFYARVALAPQGWDPHSLDGPVEPLMRLLDVNGIKALFEQSLGGREYSLGDLFLEGRRALALEVLEHTLRQEWEAARSTFQNRRDTMLFLKSLNVPLPVVFESLARAVLAGELIQGLGQGQAPAGLADLARQARELGLDLKGPRVDRSLEEALGSQLLALLAGPEDDAACERALGLLDLAQALEAEPNLWASQNLFSELRQQVGVGQLSSGLARLGRRLNFEL